MKISLRSLAFATTGILLVLIIIFFTDLLHAPKPAYVTAPVKSGNIENAVLATGKIDAIERVNVGAQVSGQVKSLKLKIGDRVKQGQLIAEIDDLPQRNELRNAQAALNATQAERLAKLALLKQTEAQFQRHSHLLKNNVSSRQDYENAETTLATTRAELQALEARIVQGQIEVEKKNLELSYTKILAPMDGTVIAIVTQQGQTVNASQSAPIIVKLAKLEVMTIKAQISEADIIHVQPGQKAYFTIFSEPEHRYDATLRSVELAPESIMKDEELSNDSNAASGSGTANASVYYNALLDVPNPDNKLRIAMTAQVSLLRSAANNVLLIPLQAVKKLPGNTQQVDVLDKNNQIEIRTIKTGITNNVDIQVVDGLKEGELVVLAQGSQNSGKGEIFQ